MTPKIAKDMVKSKLLELGLPFTKLTAKTIGFGDLARADCVFVKIHGWQPDLRFSLLRTLAGENNFRVTTDNDVG